VFFACEHGEKGGKKKAGVADLSGPIEMGR